jgi:hypothetical protein
MHIPLLLYGGENKQCKSYIGAATLIRGQQSGKMHSRV